MQRSRCLGKVVFAGGVLLLLLVPARLFSWCEHPLITHPVLQAMPEVAAAAPGRAEEITAFLAAEGGKLEVLLAEEEAWAKGHLPWYPPLPADLAFRADGDPATLKVRFARAIRINPRTSFPLYLQQVPGSASSGGRALLPRQISLLSDTRDWAETAFVWLPEGEPVGPLAVVVTASDEPDLSGLDVGLFADSGTAFGKAYGFGPQPFGNPSLESGSQAPFHMGFYHESPLVRGFAGFLKKALPEYRIHLYQSLARFAFATGHPYWGWRFTGLGLHHLADLAQPYHASALPGASTAYALWISALDRIGIHGPKNDAVQLVSNRHMALEKFCQAVLQKAHVQGEAGHPLLAVLTRGVMESPYTEAIPRDVVARLAQAQAQATDRLLEEILPARIASDPAVELGSQPEREKIAELVAREGGQEAVGRLSRHCGSLLEPFVSAGRAYVRSVLQGMPAGR